MQQDNSKAQTQSQGLVGQSSTQVLALCRFNSFKIGPLQLDGICIVVVSPSDHPTDQDGRQCDNHFRSPATPLEDAPRTAQGKRPPLLDYDRLLLHGFVTSHIGPFMRYLDSEDIDPVEAESIMEALKP